MFACFLVGTILGLLAAERLLARVEPLRLLVATSALGALAYFAWLSAGSVAASAALIVPVGVLSASYYPIAKAQAYRALPGRSGAVLASLPPDSRCGSLRHLSGRLPP